MDSEEDRFETEETEDEKKPAVDWFRLYPTISPYDVLGPDLSASSTQAQIKKAYFRKLIENKDIFCSTQDDVEKRDLGSKINAAGNLLRNPVAKLFYDQNWEAVRDGIRVDAEAGDAEHEEPQRAENTEIPRQEAADQEDAADDVNNILRAVDANIRRKFLAALEKFSAYRARGFPYEEYVDTHDDYNRSFTGIKYKKVLIVSTLNLPGFLWATLKGLILFKIFNMILLSPGGAAVLPEFFFLIIIGLVYTRLYYEYKQRTDPPIEMLKTYRIISLALEFITFNITLGICDQSSTMSGGYLFFVSWINYWTMFVFGYITYNMDKDTDGFNDGFRILHEIEDLRSGPVRHYLAYHYDAFFFFDERSNSALNRFTAVISAWPAFAVLVICAFGDLLRSTSNRNDRNRNTEDDDRCYTAEGFAKLLRSVGSMLRNCTVSASNENMERAIRGNLSRNYETKILTHEFLCLNDAAAWYFFQESINAYVSLFCSSCTVGCTTCSDSCSSASGTFGTFCSAKCSACWQCCSSGGSSFVTNVSNACSQCFTAIRNACSSSVAYATASQDEATKDNAKGEAEGDIEQGNPRETVEGIPVGEPVEEYANKVAKAAEGGVELRDVDVNDVNMSSQKNDIPIAVAVVVAVVDADDVTAPNSPEGIASPEPSVAQPGGQDSVATSTPDDSNNAPTLEVQANEAVVNDAEGINDID